MMQVRQTKFWKFISSVKLTIWLLSLIAILSLVGTLIIQNKEPQEYIARYGHSAFNILSKAGLTNVYSAWWFILLIALLSLNLITCTTNRIFSKTRSWASIMLHISILVILAGAVTGIFFGKKGYVQIREGQTIDSFMPSAKKHACCAVKLGFSLRLDDFIYEENINPKEKLLVYSKEKKLIAEIPIELGKEFPIKDTNSKVKISRYVPDFVMDIDTKQVGTRSNESRNPAIEVEFIGGKGLETFWVFANYPDMHAAKEKDFIFKYNWQARRPKDFISKVTVLKDGKEAQTKDIRVNSPLKFEGFAFFQSSYDQNELSWTGLQVVKDPGVPIVYLGFILLIAGLYLRFYAKQGGT